MMLDREEAFKISSRAGLILEDLYEIEQAIKLNASAGNHKMMCIVLTKNVGEIVQELLDCGYFIELYGFDHLVNNMQCSRVEIAWE